MRILVAGDSYIPVEAFRQGLAGLAAEHDIAYLQIDQSERFEPRTASERAIREYAGDPAEVARHVANADVLVVHGAPVTAEVMDAAPWLRLVACARGGPVNVDLDAATQRGIPVVTTPGKNADAVAELAIAFMLMLARGLPAAQASAKPGDGGSAFDGAEFFGFELAGRRLGLVGFGHVAQALAERALALRMTITAFDPYQPVDDPDVERSDDLDTLLARSDVVSLHARATADNARLMAGPQFAMMRRGALFLNTARESLVDEPALSDALRSGHLAGAALDVVREFDDGHDIALRSMRNVVITPHVGGATIETLRRGVTMLVAEIERLERGELLVNLANPTAVAT